MSEIKDIVEKYIKLTEDIQYCGKEIVKFAQKSSDGIKTLGNFLNEATEKTNKFIEYINKPIENEQLKIIIKALADSNK